jgi:peptidoglycan/xylan/chitin deacetylase (PgdA/CDA1 family)
MKTIYTCFPGGRHKALSLSYDDGKASDRRLVALLNRSGMKGTFHLNGGFLGREGYVNAEEAASLYAGHEVAAHTFTHPTFERCPKEQVALQILEDRRRLEDVAGYAVRGLSFPNGSWNREIASLLPGLGIEYARLVETTGDFYLSDDLLAWKTTCHHNDGLIGRARTFLDLHKRQYLFWFSVWGHSYEFDNDGNWDLFEQFCGLIGGNNDIWYATVIDLVDYMKAARGVSVAVSGDFAENPAARPVWLSVDEKIFEIPAGGTVRFSF